MRKYFFLILLAASGCAGRDSGREALTIWYDRPAARWEEALPLGNGRLGAMPDGGVARERIVLNDISLWSGSEYDTTNPDAVAALPRIRGLLLEGRNAEAQELMYSRFVCRDGGGEDPRYGCYQMLGELNIDYGSQPVTSDYERGLKIADAVAYTRYLSSGVWYERDYFVSRTADVVAVRLRSSEPGKLDFAFSLARPENAVNSCERDVLVMQGCLPSGVEGVPGMGYAVRAAVKCPDGKVAVTSERVRVTGATEAVIFVSASTSWWGDDYEHRADSLLRNALGCDFDALREAHTADYKHLFDRVSLDLGPVADDLPTDRRLARQQQVEDPSFAALYMQFGRYLLISSTREGSLPPNLQGLWAEGVKTPWNGDYHLNINVEMNHWLTGPGNLAELQRPLVEYVRRMVPSGERTARSFYNTGGWCAHVLANPWNFTSPAEDPAWGGTNTGGAWLALHLWEQYRFAPDTAYLRSVYPILRGAAEFFLENLIPEPEYGWLVTAPTSSPENGFYDKARDRIVYVCMGSTMDAQIVRELFGVVSRAAGLLAVDADFAARLREAALRLPPSRVSDGGYLMEWLQDYEEMDIQHRHVSHLFGLYPGTQLTRRRTPDLIEACRVTLDRRGDEGTGWSRAWKICFWARLGDGDRAFKLLRSLWEPAVEPDAERDRSGTYPNLFCAHPPFQIDGNLGGAAGIAEMLLQSHDDCIEVLPALPAAWSEGEFRGLKARGGIEVGCRWRGGRVRSVTLCSAADTTVRLAVSGQEELIEVACRAGEPQQLTF